MQSERAAAPYLVTEQQRLGAELFAALMTRQLGGLAGPALGRFRGLTSRCSGMSLSRDRGGGQG